MAEQTLISWCDSTINFWTGCRKVSPGCKFCYMYRDKERYGKEPTEVVPVKQSTIQGILKKLSTPSKIFTCSWSDFFIQEADEWRSSAWAVIRAYPQHQWQILTKRPERIEQCLPPDWGKGYSNVWLGVSVEDQAAAQTRIPILKKVPAAVRFLSCEPLLSLIDFGAGEGRLLDGIHWVIVGGESGNDTGKYRYRPCQLSWIEGIIEQCQQAQVPLHLKQLGRHLALELQCKDRSGGDPLEWPEPLRIQAFPQ